MANKAETNQTNQDSFLSKKEIKEIQSLYKDWLDNIDPEPLAELLVSEALMTKASKSTYDSKPNSRRKADFLFDQYLVRGTYAQLSDIRRMMISLGNDRSYYEIARRLPRRGEYIDFPIPQLRQSHSISTFPLPDTQMPRTSYQPIVAGKSPAPDPFPYEEDRRVSKGTVQGLEGDCDISQGPSSRVDIYPRLVSTENNEYFSDDTLSKEGLIAESAGLLKSIKQLGGKLKKPKSTSGRKNSNASVTSSEFDILSQPRFSVSTQGSWGMSERTASLLDCYGFKSFTGSFSSECVMDKTKCGTGLCVIIKNFTDDLTGYDDDACNLEKFFKNTLGYDIQTKSDLRREEFVSFLQRVQSFLEDESKYDRLFVFILSHGDENGIKCCVPAPPDNPQKKKFVEEVDTTAPHGGKVTVDEVVGMFSHTRDLAKRDSLKNYPKCFFFQICQGEQGAKGAATSDNALPETPHFEPLPPNVKISENADTMISYASVKGTKSWVESDGSIFIKHTIRVFRKYFQHEHLADMMVEVNRRVSRAVLKGENEEGRTQRVFQMPETVNRLTKKLYLCIPDDVLMNRVNMKEVQSAAADSIQACYSWVDLDDY